MRLNFLKNREKRPNTMPFSALRVDVHSHLLSALDEWPKNLKESLALIAELRDLGFQKLILTPHVMSGFYPNVPQKIKERLLILREYLEEKSIDVEAAAVEGGGYFE